VRGVCACGWGTCIAELTTTYISAGWRLF